ncbi:MAG TPA: hypothetical protein VNO21_07700 [Polyangiaceae bacterium]|nr:hypothetical protein [Polyangiaceae bacterium]
MAENRTDPSTNDSPFFCALPPPDLRRRRADVLYGIRQRVKHIEETATGFTLTFDRTPELRLELEEFIGFEAACCSFIQIAADVRETTIELHMKAAPEAKPFIRSEFIDIIAGTRVSP